MKLHNYDLEFFTVTPVVKLKSLLWKKKQLHEVSHRGGR